MINLTKNYSLHAIVKKMKNIYQFEFLQNQLLQFY